MLDLLECRPILHSRDIEETRAFLAARSTRLELPGSARNRAEFDVRYNGVYLPSMWLGYIRYGATVTARIDPERGAYWLHIPMHGRMEVAAGWSALDIDPKRAALTSPFDAHAVTTHPGTARLCLSIKGDFLARHLAALLDDEPQAPLRLAPSIELEAGFGRGFAGLLYAVAEDFSRSGMLSNPLVANDFEQLVMTSLLLSIPHNYSEALRRRHGRIAPRDVRRAIDFVHGNAESSITLDDLVRASGVAGRTLLKHFRDAHGVSPMRYLRNHRLRLAREELLEGKAGSVSEVAARWGFAHFGRFAIEYRRRFGESPSATRARSMA